MSHEADRFWEQAAKELTRRAGQAPLTPEDADKACESLPNVKLSAAEINSIIDQVTSGELVVWTPEPFDDEAATFEVEAIEDDVLQLNRHEGPTDAETDELLEELRRKALEDGQGNGKEDSTGLGGDPDAPATGR